MSEPRNGRAEEVFDAALQSLLAGTPIEQIVAQYPQTAAELEPMLRTAAAARSAPAPQLSNASLSTLVARAQAKASEQRKAGIAPTAPLPAGIDSPDAGGKVANAGSRAAPRNTSGRPGFQWPVPLRGWGRSAALLAAGFLLLAGALITFAALSPGRNNSAATPAPQRTLPVPAHITATAALTPSGALTPAGTAVPVGSSLASPTAVLTVVTAAPPPAVTNTGTPVQAAPTTGAIIPTNTSTGERPGTPEQRPAPTLTTGTAPSPSPPLPPTGTPTGSPPEATATRQVMPTFEPSPALPTATLTAPVPEETETAEPTEQPPVTPHPEPTEEPEETPSVEPGETPSVEPGETPTPYSTVVIRRTPTSEPTDEPEGTETPGPDATEQPDETLPAMP